jgi:WXG100 family type VII secretion target
MADPFTVDTDALADAVQRMREYIQHTAGVVAEANSLMAHLHETWSGLAATAHAEAQRKWQRGDEMLREALGQLETTGRTAHQNYTQAVATNMKMWP